MLRLETQHCHHQHHPHHACHFMRPNYSQAPRAGQVSWNVEQKMSSHNIFFCDSNDICLLNASFVSQLNILPLLPKKSFKGISCEKTATEISPVPKSRKLFNNESFWLLLGPVVCLWSLVIWLRAKCWRAGTTIACHWNPRSDFWFVLNISLVPFAPGGRRRRRRRRSRQTESFLHP